MSPAPVFEIKDLVHYYGEKKVLDIGALSIFKGSITGLQGPNGSGKSTLLKILAFAMKPRQGAVHLNGQPEVPFSPRVRARVSLLTQKPYLLKRSVFDNVAYGLAIRKDTRNLENRVGQALSIVGLDYENFARRKWHELSGGEAQRVAMAARLILKPEVLLLDEPVASVDTESAGLIRQASLNARKEWGTTLIIASHDLQWLYKCSDTQISIFQGRLFSTGREIIIPGPYENRTGTRTMVRPLGDIGRIRLSLPGGPDQTAVIQRDRIRICLSGEQAHDPDMDNQIPGQVISMLLEKQTGNIMTFIQVNDLSFALSLSPENGSRLGLVPGKIVELRFRSGDIQWR
ncbi:energy-coupling factor ABC transporter ATP-binding protein [Desulfospira joergensenii]|uniref:energy-coupling factor ABC transporter ATP-binding protein n=1 Tax=Desulfospira joergensenii TaxID=53329 RepID=UPI0003B58570|nr:ATP-binding cassette domain-containing protein [Desulfospira joergensenii]